MVQIGRCHDIFRAHEQQVYSVVNRLGAVEQSSFSDVNCAIDVTEENVAR
jgi:hypothetical protein